LKNTSLGDEIKDQAKEEADAAKGVVADVKDAVR